MSVFDEDMGAPKKSCIECGEIFEMRGRGQVLCGSQKEKTGCAYKKKLEYHRKIYHSRPKNSLITS